MNRPLQKFSKSDVRTQANHGDQVLTVTDVAGQPKRYIHVTGMCFSNRDSSATVFQVHDVASEVADPEPIKLNVPAGDSIFIKHGGGGVRFANGVRVSCGNGGNGTESGKNDFNVFYYEA